MRQRIFHFTVKNLEINKETRPQPKKLSTNEKVEQKLDTRSSLIVKLNLADTVGTYKVTKAQKKGQKIPKKKESKSNKAVTCIKKEAEYASTPRVPSWENFQNKLKREACLIRQITYGKWKKVQNPTKQHLENLYKEILKPKA